MAAGYTAASSLIAPAGPVEATRRGASPARHSSAARFPAKDIGRRSLPRKVPE